jgi:hypothetical protein
MNWAYWSPIIAEVIATKLIATVGIVVPHFAQICNLWFLYVWRGAMPWASDDYVNDWI